MNYYSLSEDIFAYIETKPRFKVPLIGENLKVYKTIGWRPNLFRENLLFNYVMTIKINLKFNQAFLYSGTRDFIIRIACSVLFD